MWEYKSTEELYHHGVKGMKWGVRKKRDTASSSSGGKRTSFKEKRAEKKARKDVDRLYKNLSDTRSIQGRQFATMAAMSTTSKQDRERVVKGTVKTAGRAAVTAFVMARGGYDIHWYDK